MALAHTIEARWRPRTVEETCSSGVDSSWRRGRGSARLQGSRAQSFHLVAACKEVLDAQTAGWPIGL
jgi:hypothetical protein